MDLNNRFCFELRVKTYTGRWSRTDSLFYFLFSDPLREEILDSLLVPEKSMLVLDGLMDWYNTDILNVFAQFERE